MRLRYVLGFITVCALSFSLLFPLMAPTIQSPPQYGGATGLDPELKQPSWDFDSSSNVSDSLVSRTPMAAPSPITNYSVSAYLTDVSRIVSGISTITYVNHAGEILSELYFHLYPNAFQPEGWIDISNVLYAGNPLSHTIMGSDDTIMEVDLVAGSGPGALAPDAIVTLSIFWQITVPERFDRFGWTNRSEPYEFIAYNMGNWHPILAVYDERGWDTHPYSHMGESFYSDVAMYEVSITVPDDFVVAATGELQSLSTATSTRTWNFTAGPVNDFTWCASPHYETASIVTSGVNVTSYHAPQHAVGGLRVLEVAEECLEVFGSSFGTYPWTTLAIVEADFWAGGMEYPQLVMIGRGLYDYPSGLSSLAAVTAHEIGHEWIPFIFGTDSYTEPWLDEGFASFSEYVWVEYVYGAAARAEYRQNDLERYWEFVAMNSDEIVNQTMAHWQTTDWYTYGRIVYAKGALVYDLLRTQLGNDTFYQAWQYIYSQAAHQNLRTRDFQQLFEAAVGESLDWFYDPWVYGSGVVTLGLGAASIQPTETGWRTTVQIHQLQPSPVRLFVPLVIETVTNGIVVWWPDAPLEESVLTVEIETHDMPVRLLLDPSHILLCQYGTDSILLSFSPGSPIPLLIAGVVGVVVIVVVGTVLLKRRSSHTA